MSIRLRTERAAIVAVLSAMALVVLDAGMVSVAVPVIAQSLGVAPEQAILTVTVYQGALVAALLPCAHLAERFGERRLFLIGLVLFSVASLACSLANSLFLLLAARVLQGIGGAAIMALGIALLRAELGDHRLGDSIAWNALTVAVCSAAAPVAGALVLSLAHWPWLFLIKLPVAAIALGAALFLSVRAIGARATDAKATLLHIVVVVFILAAAGTATQLPMIAGLAAAAALTVGVVLLRRLRSAANPIWPTDLLALRPLRIAVIASISCFVAQSAGILALSFQLQRVLGTGPVAAGLVMTCWPVAVAAASVVANRSVERTGSAALCVIGGLALGVGLLLMAAPTGDGLALLAAGSTLSGLGFGFFQVPNNRTLFLSAPGSRSAAAGGVQGTARLLGQTLGALLIGGLYASGPDSLVPRLGLTLASLFAFAAAIVSGTAMLRNSRTLAADGTG